MIVDTLENTDLYKLNSSFEKAFEYIRKTDFEKMELGKHIIEGDLLFALLMEYETKDMEDCKLESHRKYIDVQCILSGSEIIGVTPLGAQPVTKEYDANEDYALYDNVASSMIRLDTGQFAIFFPKDTHMPCLQINGKPEKVKKVVVKVAV